MPPTCPIGRRAAGSGGEQRGVTRVPARQRIASSARVRIRDLPNWFSMAQAARLDWIMETPPTARSIGDVTIQRRTRMLEKLSNTLVQLLELLRELRGVIANDRVTHIVRDASEAL